MAGPNEGDRVAFDSEVDDCGKFAAVNLVERFSKLKRFRRVATRYAKLAENFLARFGWLQCACGCVLMSLRLSRFLSCVNLRQLWPSKSALRIVVMPILC